MKKNSLINAELSHLVARLGHTDEITICDAGLPIPAITQRIDLALIPGVPTFIATVKAVLSEMQIEGVILAKELSSISPELHQQLLDVIANEQALTDNKIVISYIDHEQFKQQTHASKAVIRTGECTPYANVIFQSGVAF
ncbi:MAG: D-ribose pyranase [Gammaproteobacteria bacterium]|nr:D-ribose pyranase [Gammaproteobacteria bacterium]